MKKFNLLTFIATLIFLSSCKENTTRENTNREMPGNAPWISQKSESCQEKGFSISILRKNSYSAGESAYKINVSYTSTITEYCGQARRDILSNTYSRSPLFSSTLIKSNARSEEYCDRNNHWIIGNVYSVSYPNSMMGQTFTTDEHHDTNVHINTNSINDFVNAYNQIRGTNPAVPNCNEFKCAKGNTGGASGPSSPVIIGSRDHIKKLKKFIKDDIRYIEFNPKSPKDSTKGNEGIGNPIIIGNRELLEKTKKILKDDLRYVEFK